MKHHHVARQKCQVVRTPRPDHLRPVLDHSSPLFDILGQIRIEA
jgi:hypothetical protein